MEAIRVLREEIDNLETEIVNVQDEWEDLRILVQYELNMVTATDRFIELSIKLENLKNRLRAAQSRLEELMAQNN